MCSLKVLVISAINTCVLGAIYTHKVAIKLAITLLLNCIAHSNLNFLLNSRRRRRKKRKKEIHFKNLIPSSNRRGNRQFTNSNHTRL